MKLLQVVIVATLSTSLVGCSPCVHCLQSVGVARDRLSPDIWLVRQFEGGYGTVQMRLPESDPPMLVKTDLAPFRWTWYATGASFDPFHGEYDPKSARAVALAWDQLGLDEGASQKDVLRREFGYFPIVMDTDGDGLPDHIRISDEGVYPLRMTVDKSDGPMRNFPSGGRVIRRYTGTFP